MYRLFYNYETSGDVLFIVIEPDKKADKVVSKDNVTFIYADNELIGINIFKISETVKIKHNGAIFFPKKELLAAINPLIVNAGEKALEEPTSSGYEIMTITKLEEHPLDEKAKIVTLRSLEKTYQSVSYYPNLEEGLKVVVAKEGCILIDGSKFLKKLVRNIPSEVSLCSASELGIGEDRKTAFIPEGNEGEDFFYI